MIESRQSQDDGVLRQKKRSYESKIMQFMRKSVQVQVMQTQQMAQQAINQKRKHSSDSVNNVQIIKSRQQLIRETSNNRKNTTNNDQSAIANTTTKTIVSTSNIQPPQTSPHTSTKLPPPSSLRHKLSHINLSTTDTNNNIQHSSAYNHKQLLQKIQSRIWLINERISEQISRQENELLGEYERRLRQKQQLLDKLRLTTNQEMIRQKIMQRKQQLNTQKQRLIQSNTYYHEKMQQLKNLLNTLTSNNQSYQHTLSMLLLNNKKNNLIKKGQIIMQNGENSSSGRIISRGNMEKVFFNGGQSSSLSSNIDNSVRDHNEFVERVLGKYNRRSNMLLLLSVGKRNNDNKTQQGGIQINQSGVINDNSCNLPRIDQGRNMMVNSKSMQEVKERQSNNSNEYRSQRRLNANNFDSVRAMGGVESQCEVNSRKIIQPQIFGKSGQRKNSNNNSNRNSNNKIPHTTSNNKPLTLIQQPTQPITEIRDNLGYTKQYLQQFVMRKTSKKQPALTTNNNPKSNPRHICKQKQKQLRKHNKRQQRVQQLRQRIQQLQKPLRIQLLFDKIVYQYYDNQQSQLRQQQGVETVVENVEEDEEQGVKNYKQYLTRLEGNQLDKRNVVEMMFRSTQFKRYLYRLISEQLQPGNHHHYINSNPSPNNPFHQHHILSQPTKHAILNTSANFKQLQGLLK